MEFEASVVAQCDALINFIQQRKVELIEAITTEMNSKIQKVQEQVKTCDKKFHGVTGLLQYANECLQGTDAASFLLVSVSAYILASCEGFNIVFQYGVPENIHIHSRG